MISLVFKKSNASKKFFIITLKKMITIIKVSNNKTIKFFSNALMKTFNFSCFTYIMQRQTCSVPHDSWITPEYEINLLVLFDTKIISIKDKKTYSHKYFVKSNLIYSNKKDHV